jgi:hypothetical protein
MSRQPTRFRAAGGDPEIVGYDKFEQTIKTNIY